MAITAAHFANNFFVKIPIAIFLIERDDIENSEKINFSQFKKID